MKRYNKENTEETMQKEKKTRKQKKKQKKWTGAEKVVKLLILLYHKYLV